MVAGNFINGDFFIDCPGISQSALRAIFGVWINVCAAVIAMCIRSLYRSHTRRSLLARKDAHSIWFISPAVTPSEVFELRTLLLKAITNGRIGFVVTSAFCVVAAVIGAASTVISNRAVVTNTIERTSTVNGILVTREHNSISSAIVPITSRISALNSAAAPLTELFDFAPNDDENWVYHSAEWNNTWKATCSFAVHESAELHVFPSNSSAFQQEVPTLMNFIPAWATKNRTRQGVDYSGFYEPSANGTGVWRDMVILYFFASWDGDQALSKDFQPQTVNVSLVNWLAHRVGRVDADYDSFVDTSLKSDVHVADCSFVNSLQSVIEDQAMIPAGGGFSNPASSILDVSTRSIVSASLNEQQVKQPTAQEMLRAFQAFQSVKDSQYPHPVARAISARRDVVQIRLSVLVTTIGALLVFLIAASVSRMRSITSGSHRVHLPSSQLDWIVQAAREHTRYYPTHNSSKGVGDRKPSSAKFASQNESISFIVSEDFESHIVTPAELSAPHKAAMTPGSIEGPQLSHYDPWAQYANQGPATPGVYEDPTKA
ncbi:hypothetical protein GALMADRAFT_237618 [Galerina marginata CBS 339.88]|uniref:Transmembrane protein n=1 Tax=Galerina marginata (strain CBS 339.88) TaxID=685588 RepID=A0A067TR17_GALM3|nr:hypothetical protein GALMADRAFT_237618 [Galerina marginata CBS 339.88]